MDRARAGEGPSLIEFKTYRWRGHFEGGGMPDLRPRDELEEWKKKCPVAFIERLLLEKGILDNPEMMAIDNEIIAVLYGLGLQRGDVRASIWLAIG